MPREVCAWLQIKVKEMDKGCLTLIQLLTKYLDAKEIGTEPLKNLRATIKEEEKKPVVMKTKEESDAIKLWHEEKKSAIEPSAKTPTPKESPAIAPFRKEFKTSGQIGDSHEKDCLSFTSPQKPQKSTYLLKLGN